MSELLPCPFCGGEVDPEGWLGGDGVRGPECDGCGATALNVQSWNTRTHSADIERLEGKVKRLRETLRQLERRMSHE